MLYIPIDAPRGKDLIIEGWGGLTIGDCGKDVIAPREIVRV